MAKLSQSSASLTSSAVSNCVHFLMFPNPNVCRLPVPHLPSTFPFIINCVQISELSGFNMMVEKLSFIPHPLCNTFSYVM